MSVGITLVLLALALVLVAMNGFFVVAEFALVSVRRTRIEELVAQGNSAARIVRRAIDDPDRFIAATQLGITLASLSLGWIGEPAFAGLLTPILRAVPAPWDELVLHSIAGGLAFALITFLHVVLGELMPKSIALQNPERASLSVARPIILAENILRPLIWLLNGTGNALLRLLGLRAVAVGRQVHSLEELRMLVRESQEKGALEGQQGEMLQKVFEFGQAEVRQAMIPRPDIVGVEANVTLAEFFATFLRASHARFPVYVENLDNVVGSIAVKDVLRKLAEGADPSGTRVQELARPMPFVPETREIASLLTEMRAGHQQMAIVLDEFGGTAGLVTLEEMVEEIVGRISDELAVAPPAPLRIGRDTFQISAQMRVAEANEELGLDLPEGRDYETVAGFILYQLRRIPEKGETLRYGQVELKVAEVRGPKIERVQIRKLDESGA